MAVKGAARHAAKRKPVNASDPYGLTWRDGEPLDNRTATALKWAERKSGVTARVVQGSYQKRYGGGADASAGTHDQGGVIDLAIPATRRQRIRLIRACKKAGMAVWYRNWPGNQHIHAVMRKHANLAPAAAQQVIDYDNRLNGLVTRLRDRTWRPLIARRWSHRRNRVVFEV